MELLTTESYREATMADVCRVCNGCGPANLKTKIDRILGIDMFEPCSIHDWDYSRLESKKDRRDSDARFIVNLIITCLNHPSWWNLLRVPCCFFVFYIPVRIGGYFYVKSQGLL